MAHPASTTTKTTTTTITTTSPPLPTSSPLPAPTSTTITAKRRLPPTARLIPINLESAHQRSLLLAQRIICGWKSDAQAHAEWRQYSQQGRRHMFWIALLADDLRKYASAAGTLADGVGSLVVDDGGGNDGDDDGERKAGEKEEGGGGGGEVYVVGHLALDKEDFAGQHYGDLDTGLTEDDGSVLTITTLFVLPAFRSLGLAGWAMLELQKYALDPRYGSSNCRAVTLDTLSDRYNDPDDPECVALWKNIGYERVPRSNIPWYESLGFRRYGEERLRHHDAGSSWYAVYMRKELV